MVESCIQCRAPAAAQVDSVYFPQHEVMGDIGNGVWQMKEALKRNPLPEWDLRCAAASAQGLGRSPSLRPHRC